MELNELKQQYDAMTRQLESARRNGEWELVATLHEQATTLAATIATEIKKL